MLWTGKRRSWLEMWSVVVKSKWSHISALAFWGRGAGRCSLAKFDWSCLCCTSAARSQRSWACPHGCQEEETWSSRFPGSRNCNRESRALQLPGAVQTCCGRGYSPDREPSECCKNGEGNGNPLQYSCLEKSMDRGAWRAAVHGITWLSMCARGWREMCW